MQRPLVLALALGFAAYMVWRLLASTTSHTNALIDDAAIVLPSLLAIPAMWLASRRCAEPRTASAWRWLTAAYTSLAAAFVANLVYDSTQGAIPFPSIADGFFLAFYPLFLIGVLRFPRRAATDGGLRLLVDALIIVLGAGSVIWFLVLGPTVSASHHDLLSGAISWAYPIGDLLQIFAVTYVLMRQVAPASRRALQFLVTGNLMAVVANVLFGWAIIHQRFDLFVYVHIGWMAAAVYYILAGVNQRPMGTDDAPAERGAEARSRSAWLPYLAPAVAFGLLLEAQVAGGRFDRISLTVITVMIATLVLMRQYLARRDLVVAQGQLSHRAMHDALTELPNRALVLDRAEQLLSRARRLQVPMAALYLDIDGFKQINDTFGHPAGDELLKVVAARLTCAVRGTDTVGRMGGDEFVALLDPSTMDAGPELVAERLLAALRQPIELRDCPGRPVHVSASVGIAFGLQTTADELLRNADLALYQAKAAGKDRSVSFESEMQSAVEDRLLLEMDLRDAIEQEQLYLVYQPTFDLRTETVSGVEALIRWRHPERGVIGPDRFIPVAEEGGLIVPIGRWVLRHACRQAASWRAYGRGIGLSVNISARQLDDDGVVADVRDALAETGFDPTALTLEITETALMRDVDATVQRLHALKALGVRIAIDDFGTGYSSLAYLRQFPVDALKIDRSFISGIATSDGPAALIHTLIQLGKSLQIETLGEGIEDTSQLLHLQRERCDSGQGFLLARPLEVDDVQPFLDGAAKGSMTAPR